MFPILQWKHSMEKLENSYYCKLSKNSIIELHGGSAYCADIKNQSSNCYVYCSDLYTVCHGLASWKIVLGLQILFSTFRSSIFSFYLAWLSILFGMTIHFILHDYPFKNIQMSSLETSPWLTPQCQWHRWVFPHSTISTKL